MTVHGAKGLEASGRVPGGHHDVAVGYAAAQAHPPAAGQCRSAAPASWSGPAGRPTIRRPSSRRATAMLGDTEDEYRRLLYVAMTRAADRLIVGGCMPGNMNSVRKLSWYDLITKGLANSDLQLQEIETRDGAVKRYSRPEEAAPAAGAAAAPAATSAVALPSWLLTAGAAGAASRQPAAAVRSRRRTKAIRVRTRRIADAARARAAARHAGAPAAAIAARHRRRAPPRRPRWPISPAMPTAGPRTSAQALAETMLALIADAALRAGIRARQPRRGLDRRAAGAAGTAAGAGFRADRPAGGDAKRGPDRRLQDQSRPAERRRRGAARPMSASSRCTGRCWRKLYPQRPVRAALLWTETA